MRNIVLMAALALASSGASAQTVTAIEGGALASGKKLSVNAQLRPGDQVMVPPGGAATVMYGDSCKIRIQPGGVFNVPAASPCAAASAQSGDSSPGMTEIVVGGLGTAAVLTGVIVGIQNANRQTTPNAPLIPISP